MRTGHWIAIDCVVAAFAALSVVGEAHPISDPTQAWIPLALLLAAGVFVPVALRRRAPGMAFGGLLIFGVVLDGTASRTSNAPVAAVFVAAAYVLFTLTVSSNRRTGIAALGLVLTLMIIVTAAGRGDRPRAQTGGELVPVGLANILAWTTGYSVRQRRLYVVRLQQQAASTAVADERLRIARELHDVVAHSMSVIAVQAGYGQYVIDDSPDGAREALGAIQVTSREALDEMRRMLGVLRSQDVTPTGGPADGAGFGIDAAAVGAGADARDGAAPDRCGNDSTAQLDSVTPGGSGGSPAPLAPAPGLANLDRLIKRTCGAGVRVSLEVYGHARPLPAGLDLSAYRIVQEALTNVVKHAGSGARCTVHLGYDEGVLAIRVTDDGGQSTTLPRYGEQSSADRIPLADLPADDRIPAAMAVTAAVGHGAVGGGWRLPDAPPATAGHGIIGMRERAHLCGGQFTARPLREGGFQVTASLPLPAILPAQASA